MSLTKRHTCPSITPLYPSENKIFVWTMGKTRYLCRFRVVTKLSKYCATSHVHLEQVINLCTTNSCTTWPGAHKISYGYSGPISVFNSASSPSLYSCFCSLALLHQISSALLLRFCFHLLFLVLLSLFILKNKAWLL